MESLLNRESLCHALRAAATIGCSTFFGSASYVNIVEVPARASVNKGVDFQVDHFQSHFPRAKAFQGGLAIFCFVTGGASYLLDRNSLASKLFLAGGTAMLSLWPYTLLVIMPINYKLMDGDVPRKKGEEYVRGLLADWNKVHAVRTVLSGAVLATFLYAWQLK